jgi:hypothetical protein
MSVGAITHVLDVHNFYTMRVALILNLFAGGFPRAGSRRLVRAQFARRSADGPKRRHPADDWILLCSGDFGPDLCRLFAQWTWTGQGTYQFVAAVLVVVAAIAAPTTSSSHGGRTRDNLDLVCILFFNIPAI